LKKGDILVQSLIQFMFRRIFWFLCQIPTRR